MRVDDTSDNYAKVMIDFFLWTLTVLPILVVVVQISHQQYQNQMTAQQLKLQQEQYANQLKSNLKIVTNEFKRTREGSIRVVFQLYNVGSASAYDIKVNVFGKGLEVIELISKTASKPDFIPILKSQESITVDFRINTSPLIDRVTISYKDSSSDEDKEIQMPIPEYYLTAY